MKKTVRIITIILVVAFVVLTFISKSVYNANLPHVYAARADRGYVPLTHKTTGTLEYPNAEVVKTTGEWKVTEVLAEEGDAVEEGDVICRFDMQVSEIERLSIQAERQKLWSELNELNKLPEEIRYAQLRGPYVVYSELELIEKRLDYAKSQAPPEDGLIAPTSGRVYGLTIEEGDVLVENQTILSFITDDEVYLRFCMPAANGEIFTPGAKVQAQIGMGMVAEGKELFERITFPGEVISGTLHEDKWECIAKMSLSSYGLQPVAFQDIPVTVTHVGKIDNFIVPLECVFEVEGFTTVYTIQQRKGLFGDEDVLFPVRVDVLFDNGQYAVLSRDGAVPQDSTLASNPSGPIRGGSVVWVENKE